jgi:DNA-binding MarR family transcriptional regulator
MTTQDLRTMLDRIRGIRHACDLDLLLFFYRHPCALLTGEQLVAHLGYDSEQLAKSLEGLIETGFVTRSQNPSHPARLYILELDPLPGGLLSSFLKIAATRLGRLEAMRLLGSWPGAGPAARLRRRARLAKVA